MERDVPFLVGAYYFSAWLRDGRHWRSHPFAPRGPGGDWRRDFPEREPLCGWHDDTQGAVDVQIAQAEAHGIDFFVLLWYPPTDPADAAAWMSGLNAAVGRFLASTRIGRVRVAISYVNQSPHSFAEPAQWEAASARFVEWFAHPAYLRVGGAPVLLIHSADRMRQQWGGGAGVRERIATLKARAVERGLPDVLVGGGLVGGGPTPLERWGELGADGYSFMTGYNCNLLQGRRDTTERREVAYADALPRHRELWRAGRERCTVPFVPFVTANWDPRPWMGPDCMYWTGRSDEAFRSLLAQARAAAEADPRPPLQHASMVLVYAWNELAEGGSVVPTWGNGYRDVEAVRDVFHPERRAQG